MSSYEKETKIISEKLTARAAETKETEAALATAEKELAGAKEACDAALREGNMKAYADAANLLREATTKRDFYRDRLRILNEDPIITGEQARTDGKLAALALQELDIKYLEIISKIMPELERLEAQLENTRKDIAANVERAKKSTRAPELSGAYYVPQSAVMNFLANLTQQYNFLRTNMEKK